MKYFEHKKLTNLMDEELKKRNVIPESRTHVVECLIQTSLRGVDSHGINLFPHYSRAVEANRINGNPSIKISKSSKSTSVVDADHAFGHHSGAFAMEHAIKLAKETGIGAVSVINSTHFSAAAYYGLMAANCDCIGFAFTNADALVKAFGAKEAFFGTNPICFTAPLKNEGPLCLDMATSLVSWNKIMNYRREDQSLPDNWAFDEDGRMVTNPHHATSLNPVGEYKGFGLGMMVDILCSILSGGIMGKDLRAMYALPLDEKKRQVGHFFMAIDFEKFCEPTQFKQSMQSMVDRIRGMSQLDLGSQVMVPGDPEKKSYEKRVVEGIPVDEIKYAEFLAINPEFSEAVI
jgi:ureidoglycolate dehydrogenase (NAD+)